MSCDGLYHLKNTMQYADVMIIDDCSVDSPYVRLLMWRLPLGLNTSVVEPGNNLHGDCDVMVLILIVTDKKLNDVPITLCERGAGFSPGARVLTYNAIMVTQEKGYFTARVGQYT